MIDKMSNTKEKEKKVAEASKSINDSVVTFTASNDLSDPDPHIAYLTPE